MRLKFLPVIAVGLCLFSACAFVGSYRDSERGDKQPLGKGAVVQALQLDAELEDRILALDPERISEKDIETALARAPAPRIINLHGGVPLVYLAMESFAKFLIGMGYPEGKIRNSRDGSYSYSPYKSSTEIAGIIAWHYEREGIPPIIVGHSAGGIQTVKVLHELAGTFGNKIAVWNPLTERPEDRHTIIDPITGKERPVVGLRLGHASVVGSGGFARLLPNNWRMLGRLRTIPDSVEHFTGAFIGVDLIGGDFFGLTDPANRYAANGAAKVRNVTLPPSYNHVTVPSTARLAENRQIRDWINSYRPGGAQPSVDFDAPSDNLLWGAEAWHGIKKQWCLEAQRLIRVRREMALGR
jgi:hypothetical protein